MRIWSIIAVLILSIGSVHAQTNTTTPNPASIPMEAFFKDAKFTNMEISPDGKHLAVIYDTGNSNTLAIMDIGLTTIKAKINFGD